MTSRINDEEEVNHTAPLLKYHEIDWSNPINPNDCKVGDNFRINDIKVVALQDFLFNVKVDQYRLLPKPKPDILAWLLQTGFVRELPSTPVENKLRNKL